MRWISFLVAATLVQVAPSLAQSSRTGPSSSAMPESMRIQQAVTRANPPGPALITKGPTAPPAPVNGLLPAEHDRLDVAAPSRERLLIDGGASAQSSQSPTPALTPGSLTNPNVGASSSSGASPGTSGLAAPVSPTTTRGSASTSATSSGH